jgi:hypothetical protein
MKRTAMFFVSLMMVVMVSAQSSYDFMFNNVTVPAATTSNVQPKATRTVSASALAKVSAKRNSSRRATATTAPETAQNVPATTFAHTSNPELVAQAQAQANGHQQVVSGTITNVYMNGWELILTVRTEGMYGGKYDFALQGYNSNIEIQRGDFVCFVATYTGNSIPQVYANEFINPTGMKRYMNETANLYYGGNYSMMLMQNGQMNKWQRAINTVMSGAMTVASIVSLVKAIF